MISYTRYRDKYPSTIENGTPLAQEVRARGQFQGFHKPCPRPKPGEYVIECYGGGSVYTFPTPRGWDFAND